MDPEVLLGQGVLLPRLHLVLLQVLRALVHHVLLLVLGVQHYLLAQMYLALHVHQMVPVVQMGLVDQPLQVDHVLQLHHEVLMALVVHLLQFLLSILQGLGIPEAHQDLLVQLAQVVQIRLFLHVVHRVHWVLEAHFLHEDLLNKKYFIKMTFIIIIIGCIYQDILQFNDLQIENN